MIDTFLHTDDAFRPLVTMAAASHLSTALAADARDEPGGAAMAGPAPAFSPLYQQIKQLILQGLQHGEWRPGEVIPSEFELAARYKVSQGTVRKAIDELAAEHLLVRRQGRGTFVATHAEQQVQYRFLRLHPDQAPSTAKARRSAISSIAGAHAPAPTSPVRWACVPVTRCCSRDACCALAACPPSSRTCGCRAAPSRGSRPNG